MPDIHQFNLLTILGPTASGKTRLAVALARELSGEIISADSRQVFRGMEIGSGKDLHEYGEVRYHLIDILEAGDEFSLFAFQRHFLAAFSKISERGGLPILCGGTGLYLDSALRGYRMLEVPENESLRSDLEELSDGELVAMLKELKPQQHNTSDLLDRLRTVRAVEIAAHERKHCAGQRSLPDLHPLVIGIRWERGELRSRISERLRLRLENGMIDEVQRLHDSGIPWERLHYYGLEYRYLAAFLRGELSHSDMFRKLESAIYHFAKRQENWFRKMEKNGVVINWVEGSAEPLAETREIVSRSM